MEIEKKNVFLASGHVPVPGSEKVAIQNVIVCSETSDEARALLGQVVPDMTVVSITGYADYENILRQIRDVLVGNDKSMKIYVAPALAKAA